MKIGVAIMVAVVLPSVVVAAPVSLKCVMDDRGKPFDLNVEINEDAHTVAAYRPDTGGGQEEPAQFLPTEVRFGYWTINRTNLHIVRQNDAGSIQYLHMPPTTEGNCSITAPPKRAF